MASIQVGDIIALTRLAKEIIEYGWNERLNATRQYEEFGQDVTHLASNLDVLAEVIEQADLRLQTTRGSRRATLRWDWCSLSQIIGNCERTLQDCKNLLDRNARFASRSGVFRSIEWNILVQDEADQLRQRIQQHNTKILLALAPFEIDLLSRIQQDLHLVHRDLADRITQVHEDVLKIRGVIIPDLDQELTQQDARQSHSVEIPQDVADAFERAFHAVTLKPGQTAPTLQDIADAFVLFFQQSTIFFEKGIFARDRVPPDGQYVNLLKCIWLMQQLRRSAELRDAPPNSHWPSYVDKLEDGLSEECRRFERELLAPERLSLSDEMVAIWPTKPAASALHEAKKEEIMEAVLNVDVKHASEDRKMSLQLLRRMEAGGTDFRASISEEQPSSSSKVDPIDFDVRSTNLTPLYVVDPKVPFDIVIETRRRVTSLHFLKLKDVLKFQHAVTNFRVFGYSQFQVEAKFVFSGQSEPVQAACVQIWIHNQVEGRLLTTAESQSKTTSPVANTQPAPLTIRSPTSMSMRTTSSFQDTATRRDSVMSAFIDRSRQPSISSIQQSPRAESGHFAQADPGRFSLARTSTLSTIATAASYSTARTSVGPNDFMRQNCSPTDSSSLSSFGASRHSSISERSATPARFSGVMTNNTSNSSSNSSEHATTIATGAGTTGILHVEPVKPLIVLFTQHRRTGARSMVTLELDHLTDVNPERCNCRRSDQKGLSCCDVSLERNRGKAYLEARRFEPESSQQADWDVSRLAYARRNEPGAKRSAWKGLTRVTLTFASPRDKAKFTGGWCRCPQRGKTKETDDERRQCVVDGHRGLIGEAKEYYLSKMVEFENRRNTRQPVVMGFRDERA